MADLGIYKGWDIHQKGIEIVRNTLCDSMPAALSFNLWILPIVDSRPNVQCADGVRSILRAPFFRFPSSALPIVDFRIAPPPSCAAGFRAFRFLSLPPARGGFVALRIFPYPPFASAIVSIRIYLFPSFGDGLLAIRFPPTPSLRDWVLDVANVVTS